MPLRRINPDGSVSMMADEGNQVGPPSVPFPTSTAPGGPDLGGSTSNSQGPTERGPQNLPSSLVPRVGLPNVPPGGGSVPLPPQPTGGGGIPGAPGGANATPQMPKEPTPISTQTPTSFSPMPQNMTPDQLVTPQVTRRSLTGGTDTSAPSLLGKAGGLLGGGLSIPGLSSGPDDIGALLQKLLQGQKSPTGY